METEKQFLKYLIKCCENILGKQTKGVGYIDNPFGFNPPVMQLMKMHAELEVRIGLINKKKR